MVIDQNHLAIKCVIYNAEKNKLKEKINFRISNNLNAISKHEKFNIIVAGLPWEDAIPKTPLEMAFYDPNFEMRKYLVLQAKDLLTELGFILMSYCKRLQDSVPIENFF